MKFSSEELTNLLESEILRIDLPTIIEGDAIKITKRDMRAAGIKYEMSERNGSIYLELFL